MKTFFFLVGGMDKYADAYKYHEHFFENSGGFLYALLAAAVIALVCAAIFYLCFCMSRKTYSAASLPVWLVTLVVAGAATFLFTSQVLVGHDNASVADEDEDEVDAAEVRNTGGEGKLHSFYVDMEKYYNECVQEDDITSDEIEDRLDVKEQIREDLNQGEDVALMFNLNATIYALLFFYVFSLILKGFTKHGVVVPHKWPHKG